MRSRFSFSNRTCFPLLFDYSSTRRESAMSKIVFADEPTVENLIANFKEANRISMPRIRAETEELRHRLAEEKAKKHPLWRKIRLLVFDR